MPAKKQFFFFFLVYAALRVFSFYCQPGNPVNDIAAIILVLACIYLLIRKNIYGWLIVAGEIILGGSGNFLSVRGVSVRSLLLAAAAIIFFVQKCKAGQLKEIVLRNKTYSLAMAALAIWILFAAVNGWVSGHNPGYILAEIIPYLFFFCYYPLRELLPDEKFSQAAFSMLAAAIAGNMLFMLLTFTGYASGILTMFDPYYHWFRDVANGKITEYPFHYYRLVLNEQLLLVPLLIYFAGKLVRKFEKIYFWLAMALLVTLSVNITRIYLVALPAGLLFLFNKTNWKKWLAYSAGCVAVFFLAFTAVHLSASRGQSLGWEFFGLRLQSIATPTLEDSSLSRLLLLPKIMDKIQRHPLFGGGLGDTVTVYSPVFQATVTTNQFDWGYLQMADELGIAGLIVWLAVLYALFGNRFKQTKTGFLAPLCALLVINITSPALFHVLGVVWISWAASARQTMLTQDN